MLEKRRGRGRQGTAERMQQFEFAILGAGAMGSILGAHLARAGHSVAMLTRGRRAERVRNEGLRISGLAKFAAPVHVIDDPARLAAAQVLIVATKAIGTAEAPQAESRVTERPCRRVGAKPCTNAAA